MANEKGTNEETIILIEDDTISDRLFDWLPEMVAAILVISVIDLIL